MCFDVDIQLVVDDDEHESEPSACDARTVVGASCDAGPRRPRDAVGGYERCPQPSICPSTSGGISRYGGIQRYA